MARRSGGAAVAVPSSKSQDDYRAESDHRTLMESEEIRADKRRMNRVHQVHQRKAREISALGAKLRPKGRRNSKARFPTSRR